MKLRVTAINFVFPMDEDFDIIHAQELAKELHDDYIYTEWDVADESDIISVVGNHSNQIIDYIETELVSD